MKSMLVAYHDIRTEARSQELVDLLKYYGRTTVVSYGGTFDDVAVESIHNRGRKKGYLEFLKNARKMIKKVHPDIIILHDDYSLVLMPFVKRVIPNAIIIHDSSELYLVNERQHNITLKKKIAHLLRYIELKYTKESDIVIAANRERATIMKEYFSLDQIPLVYENVHKITTDYDIEECEKKYGKFFGNNKFSVLYAGGVAKERLTYKIAEEISGLGEEYQLIIVGAAEVGGEEELSRIIAEHQINNVFYLGFISREELKYLMEKCDTSISAFALDVVNNINCASGKVYEGLFLNKPLLAGENPPLKSLCENYAIGISTSDFGEGCLELKNNYLEFVENVKKFVNDLDYDHRVINFKKELDERIQIVEKRKENHASN